MGMDCYGLKPKSDQGKYFRASIWAWHPIVDVLRHTCGDLLTERQFQGISCNEGRRVTSKTAEKISIRLAQYLEHCTSGHVLTPNEIDPQGVLLAKVLTHLLGSDQEQDTKFELPSFQVTDEHLSEFADFCCESGGFEVC